MSFDDFWADYPHPENRGSKTKALESWEEKLDMHQQQEALKAIPLYRDYIKRTGAKAKMGVTWLNQQDWVGWLENLENKSTFKVGMDEQKAHARREAKKAHFESDFARYRAEQQKFWRKHVDENAVRGEIEARGLIYHGPEERDDDPWPDWVE